MPEQKVSMLSSAPCNAPLPVAKVVDRFEFARFAPLTIVRGGSTEAAVFPADRAIPGYVALQKKQAWFRESVVAEAKGIPLLREWKGPDPRAQIPPPIKVNVTDPAEFLSKPVVRIGAKDVSLTLDQNHVRELTSYGRTLIDDPKGNLPPIVVKLDLSVAVADGVSEIPEVRVELETFLTRPTVTLGGRRFDMEARHLRELLNEGSTIVELGPTSTGPKARSRVTASNAATRSIRVVAASRSAANLGVSASPMMASGGATWPSKVMSAEEWRDTHPIARPLPAPVELPEFDFPFALYLPYVQEWHLLGYSRGELLNSIALTPEEETTIEIFSWNRRRREEAVSTEDEREYTFDAQVSRKETAEVVNELQRSKDWRLSADARIGLPPVKGISLNGSLSTDTATQIQSTNQATSEIITEAAAQAGAKLRSRRQTKITEIVETGMETRVTRRLRNSNRARTVTYDFFEVLADYRVTTRSRPDQLRLCVLLPDPFAQQITPEFLLINHGTIRRVLLDRDLETGLVAVRWLAARSAWCKLHCTASCQCDKKASAPPSDSGAANGTNGSDTESTGPDADLVKAIGRVMESIRLLRTAHWKPLERALDIGASDVQLLDAVFEYRRWLYKTFALNWVNPAFWGACVIYERDALTDKTVERLERLLASAEGAWVETLLRGAFLALQWAFVPPIAAVHLIINVGPWNALRFTPEFGLDDAGLGTYLAQAREAADRVRALQDAEIVAVVNTGEPGSLPTVETPAGPIPQPAEPFPVDEMAQHEVALGALLLHIELNSSHYRMAVWQAMSPSDRAARLSLWGDLGEMLDNEVLGFVGDRVAVPFQSWRIGGLSAVLSEIADRVESGEKPAERQITLPTAGVTVDGRLGECDLCEPFITEYRALDNAEKRYTARLAKQRARLEQLEGDRRAALLRLQPPALDPFDHEVPEDDEVPE